MDLNGKVIIITGASSGIGRAAAVALAQRGARLALASRSPHKLREVAAGLDGALIVPADVTDADAVAAMTSQVQSHFGRIDVLINNAGQAMLARVEHIGLPEFRALLEVNVIGPLLAIHAVLPVMRSQGQGTLVHVTSGTVGAAVPGLAAYSASKAAAETLFLTARAELAGQNIRCILFSPGPTATGLGDNALRTGPAGQVQVRSAATASTPEDAAARLTETLENDVTDYRWNTPARP
jgi:NAD(P)-dependent dehydrogenase (short-subunit alcohol dehydrogenase family)